VTSFPLPADGLSQWLLRVTPATGFAVQQTLIEYPQVVAHHAPSAGYFPFRGGPGSRCCVRTRRRFSDLLRAACREADGGPGSRYAGADP